MIQVLKLDDAAEAILDVAKSEAERLNARRAQSEHVLLSICCMRHEGAARVLSSLGVDLDSLPDLVVDMISREALSRGRMPLWMPAVATLASMFGSVGYSFEVSRVLKFAMAEAAACGHSRIGSEHLLLGLLRLPSGLGAQVLGQLGVTLEHARSETVRALGDR